MRRERIQAVENMRRVQDRGIARLCFLDQELQEALSNENVQVDRDLGRNQVDVSTWSQYNRQQSEYGPRPAIAHPKGPSIR